MKTFTASLLLMLLMAGPGFGREIRPIDFAWGIPVQTAGTLAMYEFPLPIEVYRGVTRGDLGDICMFNGQDEMVPFTVSRRTPPPPTATELAALPLFPLSGDRAGLTEGMSLQVKRAGNGSIIRVETADTGKSPRRINAYLIDATSMKRPVASFVLNWQDKPDGTIGRVRVEGSDDLENWSTLVPDATILSLRYGDHALERRSIEMGGSLARYYRLSSPGSGEMPSLISVGARLSAPGFEQPRTWTVTAATPLPGKPGEYLFDLSGRIPLDRIRVRLPQVNTLVKASFFSRETDKDPWKPGPSSVLVYRLSIKGREISGADIALDPTPDRYWLMRIDPSGGGLGRGIPSGEFGWIPGKVVFVARGTGPFRLAYGSARTKGCLQGDDELFRRFIEERNERDVIGNAVTAPPAILGGKAALRLPLVPVDTKSAMLWGALLSGVLLLAWMAFRLYRHLNTGEDDTEDAS